MSNRDVVMKFELPRFVLVLKSKRKRKWKCKEMIFFFISWIYVAPGLT